MGNPGQFFGTDGIRGRFGEEPVTAETAYRLGRVLADTTGNSNARICVGQDTRESSEVLARYFARGVRDGNCQVERLGVLSTPGVAYHTKHSDVSFGVAITASHNPYEYNGFKVFSKHGTKLDRVAENRLERRLLTSRYKPEDFKNLHAIDSTSDAIEGTYFKFLRDRAARLGELSLSAVVDCAHGATTEIAPQVLGVLIPQLQVIGNQPNGRNINLGCGSTAIEALRQAVLATKADIGIAFDGDGDRALFVDALGQVVNGDQVLYLLASFYQAELGEQAGVVGTVMSNLGLSDALQVLDIPFARTDVGDRQVANELDRRGWQLGGEPSGHVIWKREGHIGDGVLLAICVLEVMKSSTMPLHDLVAPVRMAPQVQCDVAVENASVLFAQPSVSHAIAEVSELIGCQGRLLVRPSGTEPVLRVMVEHRSQAKAEELVRIAVDRLATAMKSS